MSRMQRDKGSRFEREVANLMRPVFPHAARGLKQCRDAGEEPDVSGLPYWPELKAHRNVSIQSAFKQAVAATDGRPPIVVSRDNRGPILVTMALDTFLDLAEAKQALDSVSVTAARAAELEAETACKALREATGRLEPRKYTVDDLADDSLWTTMVIGEDGELVPNEPRRVPASRLEAVKAQHERPDTTWHSFDEYVAEATARLEPCGYASKRDEWNDKALSGLAPPAMQAAALSRLIENDPSIFTADDLEECKRRIKRHREQRPDLFDRGVETAAEEMRVQKLSRAAEAMQVAADAMKSE